MVDTINEHRAVHILTIEDPIEVMHHDKLAIVNQRELGTDTADWPIALRAAMRQDPDVILIGEMRDAETVKAGPVGRGDRALRDVDAAHHRREGDGEPDHRLLPAARAEAGPPRAGRLAARHRLPAAGAPGRRPGPRVAMEIAVNTRRLAEAIADPEKTDTIEDSSPRAATRGCRPSTRTWCSWSLEGTVSIRDAKLLSSNTHDFTVMLKRAGVDPSLVDAETRVRRR